jgi:pSer/pThr/pTyr-binding forkhead associated (FHA) protein
MFDRVILRVTEGGRKGQVFEFTEPTLCTVGRSNSCLLHLPDDGSDRTVSRRHCLLDIDPPDVEVIDLGSLNGTYVNGHRLVAQPGCLAGGAGARAGDVVPYELVNGDEIRVGQTVLRVEVTDAHPADSDLRKTGKNEEADDYVASR